MRRIRVNRLAIPSLFLMAALWGSTFVVTKDVVARVPSADLTALRFGLALLVLVAVAPRALRMSRRTLVHGLVLGGLFTLGQLPQTYALETVNASVAGFFTGLYMVLTPVLAWLLLRKRVAPVVWAAVVLASLGLLVLGVDPGAAGGGLGAGEAVLLVSAVGFAAHIVVTGHLATPRDAVSLTIVQTAVLVLASSVLAVPGGLTVPTTLPDWLAVGHLAVVCGALTLFLQVWAQTQVDATRAAVLMGTEPVWAALLAVLLGGEALSWQLVAGGLAIMTAIQLVVTPPGRRRGSRLGSRPGSPEDVTRVVPMGRDGAAGAVAEHELVTPATG